jgi:hypothetical protein
MNVVRPLPGAGAVVNLSGAAFTSALPTKTS